MSKDKDEFHAFDCSVASIAEIPQLRNADARHIKKIRVINSDTLRSMKGLGRFDLLTEVNLSANVIERIEDVAGLKLLQRLDLSCNRIRVIHNLKDLPNLLHLNLAGNKITSIKPLQDMMKSSPKLKTIDLSGNSLHDLKELSIVPGMTGLKSIIFHQDAEFSNPFCENHRQYLDAIKSLPLPQDFQIDNTYVPDLRFLRPESLEEGPRPSTVEKGPPKRQTSRSPPKQSAAKDKTAGLDPAPTSIEQSANDDRGRLAITGTAIGHSRPEAGGCRPSPPGTAGHGGRRFDGMETRKPVVESRMKPPSMTEDADADFERREAILRDIQALRADRNRIQPAPATNQATVAADKSLQAEFSRLLLANERLQGEVDAGLRRAAQLAEDRRTLELRVQELERKGSDGQSQAMEAAKTMELLRAAQSQLETVTIEWRAEQREKEGLEEEVQDLRRREKEFAKRIEESLIRAADVSKECEAVRTEAQKAKEELAAARGQVDELRRVVKGYEQALNSSHSDALKSNELAVARLEDLSTRLRESEAKQAELRQQLTSAQETKNAIFQEKVMLSASLQNQLEAMKLSHASSISALEEAHRAELGNLKSAQAEQQRQAVANHEASMDALEEEYKTIIVNANTKHKKVLDENKQLRESLRQTAFRQKETEALLDEMTAVVEQIRRQQIQSKTEKSQPQINPQELDALREIVKLKDQRITELVGKVEEQESKIVHLNAKDGELAKSIANLRQELSTKDHEISRLTREVADKTFEADQLRATISRIESKFVAYEQQALEDEKKLATDLDDYKTEAQIKSQLLIEKSNEVEKLKTELSRAETLLAAESARRIELEQLANERADKERLENDRLISKCAKKDALLDEYEGQLDTLQRELDKQEDLVRRLRMEIESKGRMAEECFERLKQLQADKKIFEETQAQTTKDLEKNIDALNSIIRSKENRIRELEAGIREIEGKYREILQQMDAKNRKLSDECAIREKEIRTLLHEIEKQKKLAKENLANLTKIFS